MHRGLDLLIKVVPCAICPKERMSMRKESVGVLFSIMAFAMWAQNASSADDAVIAALDAEIAEVDKADDGGAGKKSSGADADASDSATDAVKTASDEKNDSGPRKKIRRRHRPSSDDQQERPRRRPSKDSKVIVVTVMGKGETKEEAKLAAFRAAVERAVGVWVDAESLMQNSEMLKDCVNTISNADIQRCETIKTGRLKSGLYGCQIQAWVEKKAITPKFADVFPAAFADVGEEASTIHVQKVTKAKRSGDAASLMTAELEGVDRMRNWVRLSVVKGKALEEVKKIGNQEVSEVPGKGLYSVRYSMKIDDAAYFKGFLPHFKEMLTKMQEGEAEEGVVLASGAVNGLVASRDIIETGEGIKLVKVVDYNMSRHGMSQHNLEPFVRGGYRDVTYFVDPISLSGFPGTANGGVCGKGGNPEFFMFDNKGVAKVQDERTFNIWLLDRMNNDRTSVRCSAYKVPDSALRAYWKALYGELDSVYVLGNARDMRILKLGKLSAQERVELVLLDERDEEIAAQIDRVPAIFLASGNQNVQMGVRSLWESCNVFSSFFIRPMFASKMGNNGFGYSTEIQREVYFPLTDSQLEKVKKVKVRFVGGKRM